MKVLSSSEPLHLEGYSESSGCSQLIAFSLLFSSLISFEHKDGTVLDSADTETLQPAALLLASSFTAETLRAPVQLSTLYLVSTESAYIT